MITEISECRICKNKDLLVAMDLGNHALSGRFPELPNSTPKAPLVLVKCNDETNPDNCGLLQLLHSVDTSELYTPGYGYRSGLNATMTNHLKSVTKYAVQFTTLNSNDVILDIGANDGTLLKSYDEISGIVKCNRIAIDPILSNFSEFYTNTDILQVNNFFSKDTYFRNLAQKAKIITSLSMFYDLENPLGFMQDIKDVLSDDGIWIIEQSYLPLMLERFSFDTVCHEHLEYYAYKQIEWMAKKVGLKIIDVSFNECNGGSFRVIFSHQTRNYKEFDSSMIKNKEITLKLECINTYKKFMAECDSIKQKLKNFLGSMKQSGKQICIYGASTKGNTLLQYFGIDNTLIHSVAERNPNKYGKYTPGTDIPISSEEEVRNLNPDFMLVLPWHFRHEFIQREDKYLQNGGQLIFPLPNFEVISKHKKILVTGISGQIGRYLQDILVFNNPEYKIYGLVNNTLPQKDNRVSYLQGDVLSNCVEDIINYLKPNIIINLVGNSNSRTSNLEPLYTMELNQGVCIRICEKIKALNLECKFINACSSEIYRGFKKKFVNEYFANNFPINPYGISKLSAAWTLKYYRDVYGLDTCNAIIFTAESPLRNGEFLIKKLVSHIKTGGNCTLKLGNINNSRDWIHAYDVANALYCISHTEKLSGDFVISLGADTDIKQLIETVYKCQDIYISWDVPTGGLNKNLNALNKHNGQILVSCTWGDDKDSEIIIGDNSKLKSIGWTPKFKNIKEIVDDMFINN